MYSESWLLLTLKNIPSEHSETFEQKPYLSDGEIDFPIHFEYLKFPHTKLGYARNRKLTNEHKKYYHAYIAKHSDKPVYEYMKSGKGIFEKITKSQITKTVPPEYPNNVGEKLAIAKYWISNGYRFGGDIHINLTDKTAYFYIFWIDAAANDFYRHI